MNRKSKNTTRTRTRKLVVVAMLSSISIFLGLTGLGFIIIPPVKATIMHIPVIIGAIIEGPIVGALIGLVFGLFSMYQAFVAPGPTSFIFWNPIIAILPRILIGVLSYYIYILTLKSCKKDVKKTAIIGGLVLALLAFLGVSGLLQSFNVANSTSDIIASIVGVILLIGVIIAFSKVKHKNREEFLSIGVAALLGTMVNTVGVLGLTYLIYIDQYAKALAIPTNIAGASLAAVGITNGIPESFISAFITIPVVLAVKKIRR